MADAPNGDRATDHAEFSRTIGAQATRKIWTRRHPGPSTLTGFGMFGIIGWSVVGPTLLGTLIGLWLDRNHPEGRPWTLTLLLAGLGLGCLMAWRWIAAEDAAMHADRSDGDAE